MVKDKSDFRIVANPPKDGSPPLGLRLTKTVRARDESLYVFMMPGLVPNPLKLSIHPTGDIHLEAKGVGRIARVDKETLIESLKSGTLDEPLARFLTPKLRREAAEGFLVPADLVPHTEVKTGEPLADADLSIGTLLESMTKVELDDTTQLSKAIGLLRADGRLPPKTMLMLTTEGSVRPIVFLSLLDAPLTSIPEKLPEGLPFPKTLQGVADGLRKYGGILFTMPDESELREISKVIGLGDLFDGINRLTASLDEPTVEAKVRATWSQIEPAFAAPARAIARAKPLRPLKPSSAPKTRRKRTRPVP
ncbi:MAG: hypothetical protein L3J68_00200 [Thermoplasmata archaeon]|nr:hypothetical protein [Thermoplasmata archaeon]